MYLDERDNRTEEMQALRPNGFTEETVISFLAYSTRWRAMNLGKPCQNLEKKNQEKIWFIK